MSDGSYMAMTTVGGRAPFIIFDKVSRSIPASLQVRKTCDDNECFIIQRFVILSDGEA